MTISQRRAELASAIDAALPSVKVRPYKPQSPVAMQGWLEIFQVDTEDATYGEVRLTVDLVIPVAASRQQFEKTQDDLVFPIVSAVQTAGGRGVVVTLAAEQVGSATLYCLTTHFLTESEAA